MMVSQDPSAMLLCRVIESKPVAEHEELGMSLHATPKKLDCEGSF